MSKALPGLGSVFPSGFLLSFYLWKDGGVPRQGGCTVWLLLLSPCSEGALTPRQGWGASTLTRLVLAQARSATPHHRPPGQ